MLKNNKVSKQQQQQTRPPVVAVLGHVDHGKTTLLDTIRKANIAAKESGSITQHIGAYQTNFQDRKITFIDTPGHAVFETMRSRGVKVADIAILVVAADDSVKPQTIEAIKHIKNAYIPIVVAINKIDLPQANIAKVKEDLAKNNLLLESYGGNIPFVEISAKTGRGIDSLLELINITADLEELYCNPNGQLNAVVIESSLHKNKGPIATVVVKDGSLKIGDQIIIDNVVSKVRALFDDNGNLVNIAQPSFPVEILGLKSVPPVGSMVSEARAAMPEQLEAPKPTTINPLELISQRETKKDQMPVVIKADVAGSLEAIIDNLPKKVWIVVSSTGAVNEQDLLLAKSTGAIIYGFNLKTSPVIQNQALNQQVSIKTFDIIYQLLEDIEAESSNLERQQLQRQFVGTAKIIAQFQVDDQKIAGCKVIDGFLQTGFKARLVHQGHVTGQATIRSLKQKTKDITKAQRGDECGVTFTDDLDFQVGDSIELLPLENKSEN